ncbi:hypothetical protein Tco_1064021 [Tanacetum coccineum]
MYHFQTTHLDVVLSYLVLLIYEVTLLDCFSVATQFGGVTDYSHVFIDGYLHAPPPPDYVPGPEHPPSPDYVPGPEYPEYVAASNDEIPVEDQPLPADTSPTALSPGYVADSDPKEDLEEDPADYPADEGDDDDDEESSEDDDDDDEEEEISKDDKDKDEKHLTIADSAALPAIDPVPSGTKDYQTSYSPIPSAEARLARFMAALVLLLPPPSLLSPWSSPLPHIPSPPLPLPSPPTKIPSLPLLLPSTAHRDDIPEADMPLRKRAHFTSPTASESRVMTAVEEVNKRVIDLATTQRQDAHELQVRCEDVHDDRALLRAQVSLLIRERRYFRSMASSYEREVAYSRQALAHSESRSQVMAAKIRSLQRDVGVLQRQRISDGDRLTSHIQHKHDRHRELVHTREARP